MFRSLICINPENNHNFAEICLKSLKLSKHITNDDLNSFLVYRVERFDFNVNLLLKIFTVKWGI